MNGQLSLFEVDELKQENEETTSDSSPAIEQQTISGNKAMQMLDLSRHSFEKAVGEGFITPIMDGNRKLYRVSDLEEFMKTDRYKELSNGTVDPRNPLNDLTGKDWLPETKSFFYQKGLGANHPEAQIEKLHPAPFSFQDIGHLIRFFTKSGMTVLDPFGGVGSTAKACEVNGRKCISIELWAVCSPIPMMICKCHQYLVSSSAVELSFHEVQQQLYRRCS